jgi:hypothetical protein
VAVADDNVSYRQQRSQLITIAGLDPVPLEGKYPTVKDMIAEIKKKKATALVCDHKLSEGSYAGFQGVEAVASLYGTAIPGILVTDYVDSDLPSITKYRRKVPVLIRGTDMRAKGIVSAINAWEQEVFNNDIPVQRRPRRAVVMVDDVSPGVQGRMLTVFVPRWREHEAIAISEELIPEQLRGSIRKGAVLTANVNTDAEHREDLFFEDFRMTPDEDLEHEPA